MAELDLTSIVAASIATPAGGVLAVYSELTGPPAKRLSTKDDAGVIATLVGLATADQGASRLQNKDLDAASTKIVDPTDTTKKWGFSLSGMTTGIALTLASAQSTAQTLSFPNITGADTVDTLGLAQTITGVKTMSGLNVILVSSSGLTIRNPANTFKYTLTADAIVADRILNLPLTTATDTLMCLGLAQAVTGALTCSGLNAVLMSSSGLTIRNPANTFSYTLTGAAIVAARQLNLPLTTATDTLMCLGLAQTVTGILTLTTPVIGAATGTSVVLTSAIRSSGGTSSDGIGYNTGAGGTVVQSTSKVTAFTLSKLCGTITFAADALAADTTTAGATWTNTAIAANDIVIWNHSSGGSIGAYEVMCAPGAGTATVRLRNQSPGSLSEAPVFQFLILKGVVA